MIAPNHQLLIDGSSISPEVAAERGYATATTKADLRAIGFGPSQQLAPALVIPVFGADGELATYQIRPDRPRLNRDGKVVKYETKARTGIVLDVPPRARQWLRDRQRPLFITEGVRKADAAVSRGLCCIALLGVWNWRDSDGLLPDWEYIGTKGRRVYVVFDSDVMEKEAVHLALRRLKALLEQRGAEVRVIYLPGGDGGAKVGLDDFLVAGHTADELVALADEMLRPASAQAPPQPPPPPPRTLEEVVATFRRFLHLPDPDSLYFVLATYAANRLPGPPVWGLLVGPPSGGKTEQVMPLLAMPDVKLASVLTEGSLLSGVPAKDHAAGAKGGLLREIGAFGYLLLKDFTSVLSMNLDSRGAVLAALREVYDGEWTRHVGTDGGKALHWKGKIGFIGGCTPAIDSHYGVMAALGERFLLFRQSDIGDGADAVTYAALQQVDEGQHSATAAAVAGLLRKPPGQPEIAAFTSAETDYLVQIAKVAARGRSAVERERSGSREITQVPEAEVPARIAQALQRLFSGLLMIGCSREDAWRVVRHVALSSMPAVRRRVLDYLAREDGWQRTSKAAAGLALPTNTTSRALEDLYVHGLVRRQAEKGAEQGAGHPLEWSIAPWVNASLTAPLPSSPAKQVGKGMGYVVPQGEDNSSWDIEDSELRGYSASADAAPRFEDLAEPADSDPESCWVCGADPWTFDEFGIPWCELHAPAPVAS